MALDTGDARPVRPHGARRARACRRRRLHRRARGERLARRPARGPTRGGADGVLRAGRAAGAQRGDRRRRHRGDRARRGRAFRGARRHGVGAPVARADVAARVEGEQVVVDGIALRGPAHEARRTPRRVSTADLGSRRLRPTRSISRRSTVWIRHWAWFVCMAPRRPRRSRPDARRRLPRSRLPAGARSPTSSIGLATTMLSMAVGVRRHACAVRPADRRLPVGEAPARRRAGGGAVGRGRRRRELGSRAPTQRSPPRPAKCLAGRAGRLAAENCLQVMGAIGFTEEHVLHRYIARATVLDVLVRLGAVAARRPRPRAPRARQHAASRPALGHSCGSMIPASSRMRVGGRCCSATRTPRCASASSIALVTAAGAAIMPPSPTPR